MTYDELCDRLEGVRPSGSGHVAKCPAHEDGTASLSLAPGEDDDKVLLHCHAGCSFDEVMQALGGGKQDPEAVYSYTDEDGNELYQAVRFPGKKFRYRHFDPFAPSTDGEAWVWKMPEGRRVLYRLPEVDKAVKDGTTVYVVEGEKDVESLRAIGKAATTNPMGSGAWRPEYADSLTGAKTVIIVADKDEAGRKLARTVYESLKDRVENLWVVEAKEGKDATDHLEAGHQPSDFVQVNVEVSRRHYEPLNLFQPVPPIKWVIENVVVGEEVTLLIADGGAGKSFVALAMALCVAGGESFIGCPVSWGPVIYVDEEGSPDLALQRLAQLGATDEQKANLHYLNFAGVDLVRHPEKLKEDALLVKPKLIVIDSHAKVTRLHEENSNNEMGRVWDDGFLPLARDTGAAVLVIHHTNGFGGSRGASQIRNSADQVLTMKKEQDGSQVIYASKPRRMTSALHFRFQSLGFGRYELQPVNAEAPWEHATTGGWE